MFILPIPFVRKDKIEFEIDVVNLQDVGYVCRVWKDGVVINDPKQESFVDPEDAFAFGMRYCKEWKG